LKRRLDLSYIEYVLRDLWELEETGFCARVGKIEHGEGPSPVMWFFPMISLFLGDTLQLDMLMGTNTRRTRRCRMCRSDKCWKFYTHADPIDFRDHAWSEEVVRVSGQVKLAQMLWPSLHPGHKYILNAREKAFLKDVKDECLTPGRNPLFQLPRWQFRRGLNSFSKMLPPDTLHTLLKGLLEHVVGWSLQVINQISRLDPLYRQSCGNVDDRLRTFPEYEPGFPFRYHKFRRGVFSLVKTASMDAKVPMSAFMLGATLGWHMPSLVLQLTFCIGKKSQRLVSTSS